MGADTLYDLRKNEWRDAQPKASPPTEQNDAVLAYDRMEYVTDERGVPVSRWDGKTTKPHQVTGEAVPDETAQVPLERYVNPRRAEWPPADVVVGNPPFIGNKRMRTALGQMIAGMPRQTELF